MYDPATSRWLSVDPAKDGINWYAYCGNNPISFVDWAGFLAVRYQGGANIDFKINYYTGELEIDFMQSISALKIFSSNTVLYGSPQKVGPGADQYNIYKLGLNLRSASGNVRTALENYNTVPNIDDNGNQHKANYAEAVIRLIDGRWTPDNVHEKMVTNW